MYQAKSYTFDQVRTESEAAYTLALADAFNIYLRFTNAAPTITIPADASVNFPIGSQIFIRQVGAALTITAAAGVDLNGTTAGSINGAAAYGVIILTKVAANEWEAGGNYTTP